MRKTLFIIAGFALSLLLLFFAVRKIDPAAVLAVYSRPKLAEMAVVVAIILFTLFMRGLRWKLLLSPCAAASAMTMMKLETIGMALNNVLPLRLGEIGRATIGVSLTGVPFLTLLSTILVERVLDTITLGVIFAVALKLGAAGKLAAYGHIVWAMVAAVVVALAALIFLEEMLERSSALRNFLARMPKADKLARQVAMGAQALRNWKLAAAIIALGIPLWLSDALGYFWAARIIGLEPALAFGQGMVLLCAAAVSVALPSMPGYFGAFELALQQVLVGWGADPQAAFTYATFVHLNGYIAITLLGIIFLYGAGHSLGGIWKRLSGGNCSNADAAG